LLISATSFAQGTSNSLANNALSNLFADEPTFLKVDEAFVLDYQQDNDQLQVTFTIADGYYLYQKQFKSVAKNASISEIAFREAPRQIEDEFFGISDVFYDTVTLTIPIVESRADGIVKIRYQGCAEAGLCYPPTTQTLLLSAVTADSSSRLADYSNLNASNASSAPVSEQYRLADMLASGDNLWWSILLFIGLGVLLAFTPCVFPMYPILSSIIVGQGKQIKSSQALALSFVYVQGMAITYSVLGLVVASAGVQFQAALQNPILLSVFIIAFIALALSMFGLYEIQLPSRWQEKLNNMSNQQRGGSWFGVFLMGVISGLIASPCTTAPLTSILLFIAQSGDLVLGFSALYALSLGMGIPLLIFGVTGGKLLPKAGAWMNVIKAIFGFMILSVAIFFFERIVVAPWTQLLWAGLGIALTGYLLEVNRATAAGLGRGIRHTLALLGLVASVLYGAQFIGLTSEHQSDADLTQSQQGTGTSASNSVHAQFTLVRDLGELAAQVERANLAGKTVMVDLYADWCVACKEFEKYTFPAPAVQAALANTVWLQIDLTDNTPTNLAFQEEFDITGLPTILFFDRNGNELTRSRVTGFLNAEQFATHVNLLFDDTNK
jgi:thiol:disulfide interchange protein DsbD